jgi:hypothetical protein
MSRCSSSSSLCLLATCVALLTLAAPGLWAQSTQGAVSITVTDPAGAVVPGAKLELRAAATNDLRTATTQEGGAYRFVGLSIGNYGLTVAREGFAKVTINPVVVEAARVTDLSVALKVGTMAETVEVTAGAEPVLETSSNMIGTTFDVKQIEDLPLGGRDLTQLSHLAPGYNGTWNGLPAEALGNNFDGVTSSSARMKFNSNGAPSVSPRIENIEEMTVQTDQLDMDQGFGATTTQMNFVTRSGTNSFHGRAYEDFRNSDLNANSWTNNVSGISRPPLKVNNFGGSVAGPILKNKLFFFASYSMWKQPGSAVSTNYVLTQAAQQGTFTYGSQQVNVLTLAKNSGLPSTINPTIANELATINKALTSGQLSAYTDPNMQALNWLQPNPTTFYYPAGSLDYHATDKLRLHLAYNETMQRQPDSGSPLFPGSDFANQSAGNKANSATFALGADYTVSPTVVNQFKAGYLYNAGWNPWNQGPPLWNTSVGTVTWNFNNVDYPYGGTMSGQQYNLPVSHNYPVISISDTVAWQRGKHQFKFGFTGSQEHDYYWNAPGAIPNYDLGLATGDPALNAFTNSGANPTLPGANSAQLGQAEQLYAVLVGRIHDINDNGEGFGLNPKTKAYNTAQGSTFNLTEMMRSWGLFAQDSWRVTPHLTINLGLRWDFQGADHDLSGCYHIATPSDIYGPSGIGKLFQPGNLPGDMNPALRENGTAYNGWNVTPQPTAGFAWRPEYKTGVLGSLLGDHAVVRGGFSMRRFTDSTQYVWNMSSDYGALYFQDFSLNPYGAGASGTFVPGSLTLGDKLPPYGYSPAATYQKIAPESQFTFAGTIGVNGMNPKIAMPYAQSWNIGIQRELGPSRVLEIRYSGNRARNLWVAQNINEVNVVENGFLTQFKNAQANLKINQQHGSSSFANNGYAGQVATPVFDAAFKGTSEYSDSSLINNLNTGQVGAMANTLAGNPTYFCNLVGAGFAPCAGQGYTGAGAGYPINYFQANPYAAGAQVDYMDAIGSSNYHALQVDFRQRQWHGIQFDANYTWSHNLGVASPNQWQSMIQQYTIRNLNLNYGPALNDTRHVAHVMATVDLPLGKGRQWINRGGAANAVFGGWTLGSIFTFQTGQPLPTFGGNMTYNDYGDGGINLNGITAQTLQSSIGVYHVNAGSKVDLINPMYLTKGAGANAAYITPNTTPGTFGSSMFLYGPHQTYEDASLSKRIPITERIHFLVQAEFLNIFNHPTFGWGNNSGFNSRNSVLGSNFGTGTELGSFSAASGPGPRRIELRANIQF